MGRVWVQFLGILLFFSGVFQVEASTRSLALDLALSLRGSPYVWNSNGPNSFDCSGFVHFVILQTVGEKIFPYPYNLNEIARYSGKTYLYQSVYYRDLLRSAKADVSCDRAKSGDIVFFHRSSQQNYNHIGLIVDPRQRTFITAQSRQLGVMVLPYGPGSYWQDRKTECYKNLWLE